VVEVGEVFVWTRFACAAWAGMRMTRSDSPHIRSSGVDALQAHLRCSLGARPAHGIAGARAINGCAVMFMALPFSCLCHRALKLGVLDMRRLDQQGLVNRAIGVGGAEGRMEGDRAYAAAGELPARERGEVDGAKRGALGELPPPYLLAGLRVGERELHDKAQPPHERAVERAFHVGGQNGQTPVRLDALEQVGDFDVGVAVVAVLDVAALAKERVRLVEQQDGAAGFGGVE